jgi:RNA polymerase sigma factor (sigma-70 family)
MPDPAVMRGVLRHLRRTERRRLYDLLGDGELLARFLADRDETAFEELVCRHGPMVRAVCRRVLGPSADADDAFQATFLVLLRKARCIRRTDLLANWLCAVAYRTARQALRRRYRLGARERTGDDLPEPCRPDDPPRDWLPLFDAALQRLPSKYREPIVLCELQGLPRPEAAKQLGVNEGTLSSRLGRARDLLRRKLGPYGFPLAVGSALAPAIVPEALTASTAAASVSVSAASASAVVLTEGVLTAMFASKLKAGALAGTAVLAVGLVAGLQVTGPANGAGGPPGKDGPPAKEAGPEPTKFGAKSDPKPTGRPAEYEAFQGTWEVSAAERDGTAQTAHAVGVDMTWTFRGNQVITDGEVKGDATEEFRLDPKAKPAAIDFTLAEFTQDGSGRLDRIPFHGIYKFEPDGRLVICYRPNFNNNRRPTRFATARNSGATLISLRRPKAEVFERVENGARAVASDFGFPLRAANDEGKPAPADADLGKVVGAWELTDVDGQTPDAAAAKLDAKSPPAGGQRSKQRWEALRRLQLLPAAGPRDLGNQPGASSYVAYVELDGSRTPKWLTLYATEIRRPAEKDLDIRVRQDLRLGGIYKLDGDKLVVCLPEAESSPYLRPTDFRGDGEGGLYLLTFQRAAKSWKPDAHVAPKPARPADPPLGPAAPPFVGPDPGPPAGAIPAAPPAPVATGVPLPPAVATPLPVPDVTSPQPAASVPVPDLGAPRSDVTPPDLERLQGVWVVTQEDGKPIGYEPKRVAMEFLKDRVLMSDGTHGRVRLDELKSPRQIMITMGTPDEPPITGIYKLEADRLTIASCAKSAKLIPTGFEPEPEAGITVTVYERQKAQPAASVPQTEPPVKGPPRHLQKEIDQLREQLRRLEKELKDGKDGPPSGPAN